MSKPIDWTKPVEDTKGNRYVVVSTSMPGARPVLLYPADCIGDDDDVGEHTMSCRLDGKFKDDWPQRFRNVREKKFGWLNIYDREGYSVLHYTRESADKNAGKDRTACIEISWHDGEGLDE